MKGNLGFSEGGNLSRLERFENLILPQEDLDAFLILDDANRLYLSGFPGGSGLLFSNTGVRLLYVHELNYMQAESEVEDFQIELLKPGESLVDKVAAEMRGFGVKSLAVDTLSWREHQRLTGKLGGETNIQLKNEVIEELRKVKDAKELKLMRKAAELTSEGMRAGGQVIQPGKREYEVAAEVEYAMRKEGSGGTAFRSIVASGPRSAFPHGGCTDRKIREGDLVVVDIGAIYQYYRSDMTRTFCAGEPSKKQERIYHIVKEAQEEAFQALRVGSEAREIDRVARRVIREAGYGEYFVHGLGHGVGLEAHEPPTLNPQSKEGLEEGNVVTIEPGLYLRGFGGIRLEDTVLVESGKTERLTRGSNSLHHQQ